MLRVLQTANIGRQLAGGNSSWCPELESRTTPQRVGCVVAGRRQRQSEVVGRGDWRAQQPR